ncbi:aspartate aminotransferase family protein [Candidatus Hydrogenedentota bacterium]
MQTKNIMEMAEKHLFNNYGVRDLALVRGSGTHVWDADGNEYLDFFCGIAVTSLGHCHPEVVQAIKDQAEKLMHVSNLYLMVPQTELARRLTEVSFADRCFFCNSGAEANESAMKLARKYWSDKGSTRRDIIYANKSFHGRTLATLAATGQNKYRAGFDPLPPGFKSVEFNDVSALECAVDENTAAILLEPIQGEGGVNMPDDAYLPGVRKLCDQHGILLILDEVQVGVGRTCELFAHQGLGVEPDMMTLAKAIGGGLPLGVMLAKEELVGVLSPSSHASTFGGNPVCCAAGLATLEVLTSEEFLPHAASVSKRLFHKARDLKDQYDFIVDVRGRGMIIGIEMTVDVSDIVRKMRDKGVLIGTAGANVLRMLPPLVALEDEVDHVFDLLDGILRESSGGAQ